MPVIFMVAYMVINGVINNFHGAISLTSKTGIFDVFWTITAQTGHHSADFLISQAVEAHLLSLLP